MPTPPNSSGDVVLALLAPGIFVLGIVAAIAIPVHQSYALRANGEYVQPAQSTLRRSSAPQHALRRGAGSFTIPPGTGLSADRHAGAPPLAP